MRIEDYLPLDTDRVVTVSGTLALATGVNGSIRWGVTEAVSREYCEKEQFRSDSTYYLADAGRRSSKTETLITLERKLGKTLSPPEPIASPVREVAVPVRTE